ncbi:profilin-like [Cebidichthys violaceus]|uniref:profilin-like n=1 Tax=Cebidichthys violaceus TaxID=271503 RepID=UPI0035C94892
MSWDAYRDQLKAVETVTEVGIFGLDGSTWSKTDGMPMMPEQVKVLCGDSQCMRECGPKIGTIKCMLLRDERNDEKSCCMHLKTSTSDGKLAVCVGYSKTAILVVFGSGHGNLLSGPVFKMVNYLREAGY